MSDAGYKRNIRQEGHDRKLCAYIHLLKSRFCHRIECHETREETFAIRVRDRAVGIILLLISICLLTGEDGRG